MTNRKPSSETDREETGRVPGAPGGAAVAPDGPLLSVIILNYNGARWIDRCLASLQAQSLFSQIEVIVADNQSRDGSDRMAEQTVTAWPNGRFLQNGANLGYCEGNNRPARLARGRYLFFLNNDTWLEPDCLEQLIGGAVMAGASAATPLVMNLDSDEPQWASAAGLDVLGFPSFQRPPTTLRPIFMPGGCSYLITRALFDTLGGFDSTLFMYADELDLSWRVWLSGHTAVLVPAARLHHRGAAVVNPKGDQEVVEMRTSDTKRFYANRNNLLALLKNAQHLFLLLVPLQLLYLAVEALIGWLLVPRWSFVREAYLGAVADCWRLRHHIVAERRRLRALRRRSDWWMLRFLRLRLNRWDEFLRMIRLGRPRVTPG